MTIQPDVQRVIDALTFEPRTDYGPNIEAAWSHDLADAAEWECLTGLCQGDDEPSEYDENADDGEYRGWPKWERVERDMTTKVITSLTIECGHCGCTTDLLTGDINA